MDIKSIYSNIKGIRYIGLTILIGEEGLECHGSIIVKRKNDYVIEKTFSFNGNISEIYNHTSRKFPLILNFDGTGIIHKSYNSGFKEEDIKKHLFPGLELNDYIIQNHLLLDGRGYISVARKKFINEIIIQFKELGFYTAALYLGPFVINKFLCDLSVQNNKLQLYDTEIEIDNNFIFNLRRKERVESSMIMFQKDIVPIDYLSSYCAVLNYKLNNEGVGNKEIDLSIYRSEIKYQKQYFILLYVVPLLLLMSLLVNFIYYNRYSRQLNDIHSVYDQNIKMLNTLKQLEKEYNTKDYFIKTNSLTSFNANIYYCDQLAASVPDEIRLNVMEVNPMENGIKSGKRIVYKDKLISIKGEVGKESILRSWIRVLKMIEWVENVRISKFHHQNNKLVQFEIELYNN